MILTLIGYGMVGLATLLALVILAILFVPVSYRFRWKGLQMGEPQGLQLDVAWAGLLHFSPARRSGAGSRTDRKGSPKRGGRSASDESGERRHRGQKPKERRKVSFQQVRPYLGREVLAEVIKLVRRLFGAMHPQVRAARIAFGLEDPADTAYLWLALLPLTLWFPAQVTPTFNEQGLSGEADVRGWLIPGQLIGLALITILARPVRRVWWNQFKLGLQKRRSMKWMSWRASRQFWGKWKNSFPPRPLSGNP